MERGAGAGGGGMYTPPPRVFTHHAKRHSYKQTFRESGTKALGGQSSAVVEAAALKNKCPQSVKLLLRSSSYKKSKPSATKALRSSSSSSVWLTTPRWLRTAEPTHRLRCVTFA